MLSSKDFLRQHPEVMLGTDLNVIFDPPQIHAVPNAFSAPLRPRAANDWWTGMAMGFFSEQFRHIEALSDKRQDREIFWPDEESRRTIRNGGAVRIEHDAIYGGTLYKQFGHTITDSLARLYPFLSDKRFDHLPIIFQCPSEAQWQAFVGSSLASALSLSARNIIWANGPLSIRTLHYCDPLFQDGNFASAFLHKSMSELVPLHGNKQHKAKSARRRKIAYISRSRLSSGTNHVVNEEDIDHLAEKYGMDVIYPEIMSVVDQIDIYGDYDVVCGFPSSFFHVKLFHRNPCDIVVLVPDKPDALHINFVNIDVASSFDDRFAIVRADERDVKEGFTRSRWVDPDDIDAVMKAIRSGRTHPPEAAAPTRQPGAP
jgi:hypothetical protein